MDIVDAQIHMGPGGIDPILKAMDALGIAGVLVDEYWLTDFANRPHHLLPGGAQRPVGPTAELAAQLHPERFSWLLRVNRLDPDHGSVVTHVRDAPGGRALRIDPGLSPYELWQFGEGGYDHILKSASEAGLPLFVFAPDSPDAFVRAARNFPELSIVVDHCGLYSNSMRTGFAEREPLDAKQQLALFEQVLVLSEFSNVALKWGHASAMFDQPAWPGEGLWPILHHVISAFGANRVMWASDFSVNQRGESWADLLYGVKADPGLGEDGRAAVLG
ncbi:MAG: amidohydrolase family protein, partial [Novosphingobium sp.]|nr:amidohydrolase family protein [Novosphingobium sp.]